MKWKLKSSQLLRGGGRSGARHGVGALLALLVILALHRSAAVTHGAAGRGVLRENGRAGKKGQAQSRNHDLFHLIYLLAQQLSDRTSRALKSRFA